MKKIKNPWVNKKNYNCFGCCPDNPSGLHMEFYADNDEIVSYWEPNGIYQGWINTLHGGIQSVLLDEIGAWAVMFKLQTTCVTAKMETRYKHSVSTIEGKIELRARVMEVNHNFITVKASLIDSKGVLCTQATSTYFSYSSDKAKEMGFVGCFTED
jgi:uncharacterized protein (TIGR00369 family)